MFSLIAQPSGSWKSRDDYIREAQSAHSWLWLLTIFWNWLLVAEFLLWTSDLSTFVAVLLNIAACQWCSKNTASPSHWTIVLKIRRCMLKIADFFVTPSYLTCPTGVLWRCRWGLVGVLLESLDYIFVANNMGLASFDSMLLTLRKSDTWKNDMKLP